MVHADKSPHYLHDDIFDTKLYSKLTDFSSAMDSFDSSFLIRDFHNQSSSLQELKPLEPTDYNLNVSPDTSISHNDIMSSECSVGLDQHLYSGPIISDTLLGHGGTPEPVSTTGSPTNLSGNISIKQEETESFLGADTIEDLASVIGGSNTDWVSQQPQSNAYATQISDLPESSVSYEDWLLNNGNDVPDQPSSSTNLSLDLSYIDIQSPQPSSNSVHSTVDYSPNQHHSLGHHVNLQPLNNSIQELLAASTVNINNNIYLQTFPSSDDSFQKSQPILYNKLTQPQKDTISSLNSSLLKNDPIFARNSFYHKEALPHMADSTNFGVSTTDDILSSQYDQRYQDYTQLGSPDSDLSSTQLGYEFGELKSKNRNRVNKSSKIPTIRTEGTKEKPMHHCTVCQRGFLNKSNIKVHLRTHTGEKPFRCETCNKTFRQKAHLLKHYQIHKRGL